MQRPDPRDIPLCPGVYLYKDAAGRVIYVGKARTLRSRVLSYFRSQGASPKTLAMLRHAHSLDTLPTATEKEALLLEASLIKRHRPRYNIVLSDDKQYPLFRVCRRHPFPRLEIVRSARRDGARYFGPYASSFAARQTWKILHAAFALRRCSDRAMRNRKRPCLYHHMRQCLAPCMGRVEQQEYARLLDKVEALLAGRSKELLEALQREMELAADLLEFERAAALRDQIHAVRKTLEHQAVVLPGGGDLDALGLAHAENGLGLGVLFVRNGALLGGRTFFWPGLDSDAAGEVLLGFPSQFYGRDDAVPPRVIYPWLPEDADDGDEGGALALQESLLTELRGSSVRIQAAHGADERRLVDMAALNAREEALRRKAALPAGLAGALHLPAPPGRIECIDVSHSAGQAARAGMVVFEDGRAAKDAYRTYALEDTGGDDHAALRAWLTRRLASGPPWPDLLLIDGGRGQLATVQRALEDAGQAGLFALASIAKAREDEKADRRAGNIADRIFLPERVNPLPLKPGCQELLFLQQIRDCAHRFALGAHRKARGKEALTGELSRMPGIGHATSKLLWEHFDSLPAMRKATAAELEAVPGIGKRRAAMLFEKLKTLG
ncbi:MAG: excinuclease ABC subunit UvrC [Deltaproteobacteria bacterium]|nr:excinuclease ABC subunit UvrC [Deltaproteobacteria bacterium]